MRRYADHLLVALYVALAALPAIALALGIKGREVGGTLAEVPRPSLRFGSFVTEAFQTKFVAWFEANLGFKGNSIAYDNALLYRVFREAKPGAAVRVGRDGVLFIDEDTNYYNKYGPGIPTPEVVDGLVVRIAKLQTRFAAEQKAFVPILIPAKTSIWRDKVPDQWMLPLGDPRPTDTGIYRAFKEALDRHHVRYVDARAMFETSKDAREALWGADARHWSTYGACLGMQAILREASHLTGRPLTYDCPLSTIVGKRTSHDDFDLWRLLNAWWVRPSVRQVPAVTHAPLPADAWRPSLLLVGTSFCWQLLRDAQDSQRFGVMHMNYYNKTFVPWPEGEHYEVRAGTPEWKATTLGKDIYVLDLFEGYLGAPGAYVPLFLDDFEAGLAVP